MIHQHDQHDINMFHNIYNHTHKNRRSLEVKLPTIRQMKKQRWEESEKIREEKRESEKSQKKEDAGARKK